MPRLDHGQQLARKWGMFIREETCLKNSSSTTIAARRTVANGRMSGVAVVMTSVRLAD